MGENLKCSLCGSDATVHLTQIVNNKIHKVDLCESCAQKKGVTSAEGFSLADLLSKANVGSSGKGDLSVRCTKCGHTTADFRRTGRLGCPACYKPFRKLLLPALEEMHPGTSHTGKVPERSLSRSAHLAEMQKLKSALTRAVEKEEYEEAARLRDQIQQLEAVQPAR